MFLRKFFGLGLLFSLVFSFNTTLAFDSVAGGGSELVQSSSIDNENKVLLKDLVLTRAAAVVNEPVIITFDPGTAFAQLGVGAISFGAVVEVTTVLDTLTKFADGDIITVEDSSNVTTTFNVTAVNTIGDLQVFFDGIAGLSAVFDDPNDRLNLSSTEDFQITSTGALSDITLNFIPQATLNFSSDLPNLIVNSGNFSISNFAVTPTQINFFLNGSGTLTLEDIGIFGANFLEKGEFMETRRLEVDFLGANFNAEPFIVDTTDYSAKGNFLGATAGVDSDIFKLGDVMLFTFSPFDYSTRGTFGLDLSSIGGSATFDPLVDAFVIIDGDDDGSQSVPMTMTYSSASVTRTISSKLFKIDNQKPSFDLTDFKFVELPEGKVFAGINDIIKLKMPPESTGDAILFTVDFQDVAGLAYNFVDEAFEDKDIPLAEVVIDNNTYIKNITFIDDVGNFVGPFATNAVGIDLIRPVVADTSILSITGNPVPGVIGDTLQVGAPIDSNVAAGETTRFTIDLSELGGASANFDLVDGSKTFPITAGNLNDALFSKNFTVFDKADNTLNVVTNPLQIDNQLPAFDTLCGATFTVNDKGPGDFNQIADITNGEPDTVTFKFPDKTIPGCDLETFTIDFEPLASNVYTKFTNQNANGISFTFPLGEGGIDENYFTLPITIFDINGNETNFSTGGLAIDNDLLQQNELQDKSFASQFSTPDQELHPKASINVKVALFSTDIQTVEARIEGASDFVSLSKTAGSTTWSGNATVVPGLFIKEFSSFIFRVTDDAGNVIVLDGEKDFFITNDTRQRGGGGGGSLNFGKIKKKGTFQVFTPNQSKEFHDETWKARKKSKAQMRLESLRRRLTRPATAQSRILVKTPDSILEKRKLFRSRQAAIARDGQPKKLQEGLEKVVFRGLAQKKIKEIADDTRGEFRLQSTLNNLKTRSRSALKRSVSRRHTGINKSGKYLRVK